MQENFRRLFTAMQEQYASVLTIMAIMTVATYFTVISQLQDQEGNAILVKLSSDQGQLVNRINFLTTQLADVEEAKERQNIRSQIIKNRAIFKETHITLRTGDRFVRNNSQLMHVPGTLTNELRDLYFNDPINVDRRVTNYLSSLNTILRIPTEELVIDHPELIHLYQEITPKLLSGLDKLSVNYQKHTEFMLGKAVNLQNLMFFISLSTLILVGTILLKPLVLRLKDTAHKVQEEKNFADNVINTAEALIIGLDTKGKVVLFNHYAEELTGWGEEEVKGVFFLDHFIPDGDRSTLGGVFDDMMQGVLEFADELETQMMISTGDRLDIIWHTTVVKDPRTQQPVMFLATGLDITERKAADINLQKANAEMAELSLRLQSEVNLAATLQRSILPDPKIELPGLQGLASLLTSSEVGGDYYDYFKVGAHTSVVIVGDVSGHGVAAGTMVSAAKAGLYPLVHEGVSDPSEILQSLNETILATAHQSLLMTMACVTLDARNGRLKFANAGHVLPYLWKHNEGHWEMLEASGLPLGKSLDADYRTSAIEVQMDVGDRLFLFTDAIVEEESPAGEPFGYDRLENILNECSDVDPDFFQEVLLTSLQHHCEVEHFGDDVTMLVVNHTDRVSEGSSVSEASDIVRLTEAFYRQGNHPIPRIPREFIVFLADGEWADLLPRFGQDGICRVLPTHCDFCENIGWDHLFNQHHKSPDDDLYTLIPHSNLNRQYQLTHTDDKMFIMEEIQSWLSDQEIVPQDHLDTLIVALDEMIENSLYAAPRDGKGVPYYEKGIARELSEHEEVRIDIALKDGKLGLMITDNWGTLTPAVFLKSVASAMEGGVESGVGGAGLYMMWRMSDYFQIRVYPQQRTQVSTLWDLTQQINMDTGTGFQFLYHSDYDATYQTES